MGELKLNTTSLFIKRLYIVVLFSMIIKPSHFVISVVSNVFKEKIVKIELDESLDSDSHEEDDKTEEDSKEDKDIFKIIPFIESYSFSYKRSNYSKQVFIQDCFVLETLLPPPDVI